MPKEREIEEDRDDLDSKNKLKENDKSLLDDRDLEDEDDGPDNAEARREQEAERRRAADRDSDRDEDEDDARLAYDDDDGEPVERLSRRRRRNRSRRERSAADRATIEALTAELANMRGHIDQVSRGQLGLAASDLDSQIAQLQGQLEVIEEAQARAVKDGSDEDFRKAKRLEAVAQQKLGQLGAERARLVAYARQGAQQPGGPQRPNAPDPRAARFAERFMERHDWFDPSDASDEDSNMVKAIDAALVNEGYDPGTKRFWVELEKRAKRRGLGDYSDQEDDEMRDDDDRDERRERRPARRDSGGLPPRSRGGSRGGSSQRSGFRLTPMMKDALEAENLLDEKNLDENQKKYRNKLINTWRESIENADRAARR